MFASGGGNSEGVVDPHLLVGMLPHMDPGTAAGRLAEVDRRVLNGHELAILLRVEARIQAWLQAGMAASMVELSHAPASATLLVDDGPAARTSEPQRYATEEIALALGISPGSASWHLSRARFARQKAPAAWHAWRRGDLSQAKVWACHDELTDCDEAVTDEFVRRFFDDERRSRDGLTPAERAADDTPAQLRERARRLVAKLDADVVRRRHDRRIRGRHVRRRTDRDGVGYLSGCELPADAIAEACEHVDAIARSLRNNGDTRTLEVLRADVFTELLSGRGYRRDDLFGDGGPRPDEPAPGQPAPDRTEPDDPAPDEPAAVGTAVAVRPVHLLLPHDLLAGGDTPGDVFGFGCIPARAMRRLVWAAHQRLSTWAVTVVDPTSGRPTAHVRQTCRPDRLRPEPGPGWLVEFMLPAEALDGDPQGLDPLRLAPPGVLAALLAKARAAPTDWCATSHGRTAHDPTRAQKHFVQARDRYCCFPGCRRRAVACDVDHLVPHERSGPTCPCNLHPLCRRHHQTKQEPGWVLIADHTTGRCSWASPHGLRAANDSYRLDPLLYERR